MAKDEGPLGHSVAPEQAETVSTQKICGIVMPIAEMPDDYSLEHWRRVRKVLERSIGRAGLKPQLVWESPEVDVIQSRILQNIYENDVVVCDVSGLNPNVMLETDLRLSTKRPTIIITDKLKSPPFGIGTIGYIEYPRDLEYNAIEDFMDRLVKRITEVLSAVDKGTYKSFVENYHFETVLPSTVTVSSEDFMRERVEELSRVARRIENELQVPAHLRLRNSFRETEPNNPFIRVIERMDLDTAKQAETELDQLPQTHVCNMIEIGTNQFMFVIMPFEGARISKEEAVQTVKEIVAKHEAEYVLS